MSASRLFVSIGLPPDVRSRIWAAASEVRTHESVRAVSTEQLHLTLRFLGDVQDDRISALRRALAAGLSGASSFDLELRNAGAFPTVRRPSVIWIGADLGEPLAAAQRAVEAAVVSEGARPERRPFHPHVTLGRVRRGRAVDGLDVLIERIQFEASVPVSAVSLMKSELAASGARHSEIARFELERAADDATGPEP